jgi:HEAT repeat protein
MPILDPSLAFLAGFLTATIFWWLMGRIRPLWGEIKAGWQKSREEAQARRSTGVEENHRRTTLRRAQGMHLAAPLFALDEILEPPRLLAPPPRVEPGGPLVTEDIVSRTVPYIPSWPELAAVYCPPTFSLVQALSGGVNLVVAGQPGTGKTVSLAHLASLVANRDARAGELANKIPFLYHIADLRLPEGETRDALHPIIEAATEHAPVLDLTRLPNFIQYTFQNGNALLLLDGFDELTPGEQAKVSNYLKSLLDAYPQTRVATTGCPEQFDGLLALGFAPMTIAPWKASQRNDFIDKWGQLWMQTVAVEAWAQTGPEQVDPLLVNAWLNTDNQALTPLELTLKIWAGYAGDSLGPGILDAIATHIRRLTPSSIPLAALETLGMQVMLSSQPIFDPRSAREWVKKFELPEERPPEEAPPEEGAKPQTGPLGEKKQTGPLDQKSGTGPLGQKGGTGPLGQKGKTGPLGQKSKAAPLPATSGLLGKITESGLLISHPHNRMRFLHPVLGGYLAGRALAGFNAADSLLDQPDWSGKLLTMRYLAAHGDATALVEALLGQSEPPLQRPLLIAARWLRDAPRSAAWRGKVFARLAALLQTESIPLGLRAQAVAAFAWSGDPGAAPLFRQFLQTTSFELLQLATLGCGAIRDAKAVEQIAGILYAPSLSAQRAACLALVAIGSSPAMEAVARALLHGEEDLRRAAAEALANDPGEGHAMLKDGVTLTDILLRRAVVYGLARVDEPWAIEILQRIQVDDEQWVVRNSATEVLDSKNAPNPRIPRPLTPPAETPWLIEFAGKQGLGISPGSPATDILVAALKSDIEEERLAALPYLERTPTGGVIASLYHAMDRDDPELREAVFLVLCELAASGVELPKPQQFGLA